MFYIGTFTNNELRGAATLEVIYLRFMWAAPQTTSSGELQRWRYSTLRITHEVTFPNNDSPGSDNIGGREPAFCMRGNNSLNDESRGRQRWRRPNDEERGAPTLEALSLGFIIFGNKLNTEAREQ